jgi:hypothetical protein
MPKTKVSEARLAGQIVGANYDLKKVGLFVYERGDGRPCALRMRCLEDVPGKPERRTIEISFHPDELDALMPWFMTASDDELERREHCPVPLCPFFANSKGYTFTVAGRKLQNEYEGQPGDYLIEKELTS